MQFTSFLATTIFSYMGKYEDYIEKTNIKYTCKNTGVYINEEGKKCFTVTLKLKICNDKKEGKSKSYN